VKRPVVVYLRTNAGQPAQPVQEMKRQANALMDAAVIASSGEVSPTKFRKRLKPLSLWSNFVAYVRLRTLRQRGRRLPPLLALRRRQSPTAKFSRSVGANAKRCRGCSPVPFKDDSRQDFLYARAMGRLLVHKLYHILMKTRHHDASGIGKPSFSAKDVLSEHLVFDTPTREIEGAGNRERRCCRRSYR